MRKSNIIILAILLVASCAFLGLWYYLRLNLVHTKDLVITIVWWVVIVAVCVAIHLAERKRRQSARTAFIAPSLIYNSEAGIVRLNQESNATYVNVLRSVLSSLKFKSTKAVVPNQEKIRFKYIVRTSKFKQNGAIWEGEVVNIADPSNPASFYNEDELAMLLDSTH